MLKSKRRRFKVSSGLTLNGFAQAKFEDTKQAAYTNALTAREFELDEASNLLV